MPATGDLVVPDINDSITQLVLSAPMPELYVPFSKQLETSSGRSTVLFYGTPCSTLLLILRSEFNKTMYHGQGVFMAEEPLQSHAFAFKLPSLTYEKNPYSGCGILLGLEVAGEGHVSSPGIHVIQKLDSIMVRYVFVLPASLKADYGAVSNRRTIESTMKRGFAQIEKSIQEGSK